MEKFTQITSVVAPLDRGNIDTDQIIPKQFLRSISRIGFGPFLFDEWRYLDQGELGMKSEDRPKNPNFSLNHSDYQNAEILLTRENFGCGSSREHAVWALMEYGFRVILAPSFGDIFSSNSAKNGLLLVVLPEEQIEAMFVQSRSENLILQVDLASQTLNYKSGEKNGENIHFDILPEIKERLLSGMDEISVTLQDRDLIKAYEEKRRELEPWIFQAHPSQPSSTQS